MRLTVEIEHRGNVAPLPGDGGALIAFMSFAVLRGFGAQHPLLALAERLAIEHGVRMGPLTTFYERTADDEEDREKLEMAWQAPGDLVETLTRMHAAFRSDATCDALLSLAGARELPEQTAALIDRIGAATTGGSRVRLSYDL